MEAGEKAGTKGIPFVKAFFPASFKWVRKGVGK